MIPHRLPQTCLRRVHVLAFGFVFVLSSLLAHAATDTKSFDVPAGVAPTSLKQFAEQAGGHVLYSVDDVTGEKTLAVKGEFTPREALNRMLAGTTLYIDSDPQTEALTVRKETEAEAKNVSRAIAEGSKSARPGNDPEVGNSAREGKVVKLDTFEVFGRKTLNMDIQRSRDDAQPYVILSEKDISRSGASSLEEFLARKLTVVTSGGGVALVNQTPNAADSVGGNAIQLRGLPATQTLILVDGRRLAGRIQNGAFVQPDLRGIPLSAIERVEVLPTSAAGIYGGEATGGVINIILKRNYTGGTFTLAYGNTFSTDVASRSAEFAAGLGLFDGKINFRLSGAYSDGNSLTWGNRDFYARWISHVLAVSPGTLLSTVVEPLGAATTNIRSTGPNLTLKSTFGGASLGSPFTFVPNDYAGPASDNGAALRANAGKYNFELGDYAAHGGNGRSLWATPTQRAISAYLRAQLSDRVEAFADYSYVESVVHGRFGPRIQSISLANTSPNNPFNETIVMTVPAVGRDNDTASVMSNVRLSLGLIAKLPRGWQAEADYTKSLSQFRVPTTNQGINQTAFASAVSNGSVDVLRDPLRIDLTPYLFTPGLVFPTRSVLDDFALRTSGDFEVASRSVAFSALVEHRKNTFGTQILSSGTGSYTIWPERSRAIDSYYLEALLPIFERPNQKYFKSLTLQLAGRSDIYHIQGVTQAIGAGADLVPTSTPVYFRKRTESSNPTVATRLKISDQFSVRGSYNTGFVPPSANEIVEANYAAAGFLASFYGGDPLRNNEAISSAVLVRGGGNVNLQPERTESWSSGVILTPTAVPGLRVSLDWTQIRRTDAIRSLASFGNTDFQTILTPFLPNRIQRGPASGGFSVGPIMQLDFSAVNLTQVDYEFVDAAFRYERVVGAGELFGELRGTLNLHQLQKTTPAANELEIAGSRDMPRRRAVGTFGWESKHVTASWSTSYMSGYYYLPSHAIVSALRQTSSPSQVYHDVALSYRFSGGQAGWKAWLQETEVSLTVSNLFNTRPPLDGDLGTAAYSLFADPRLARYNLSVRKSF